MVKIMIKQAYEKIKCKYIDIPILISAVALIILSVIQIILRNSQIGILGQAVGVTFSLFANLIIWKMIQLTFKLKQIKLEKVHIITMLCIFAAVTAYFCISAIGRDFIYYWDYSNYLQKQYDIEDAFNKSVLHGIFNIVVSLNYDYTNFIAAFMELPFAFSNHTGNAYVVSQTVVILLPIIVLVGGLVIKTEELFKVEKRKGLCFVLSMTAVFTFPLLYRAALWGQPDWFGIIFCVIIMLLTMDYNFEEFNPVLCVVLFFATAGLIATRRWYLYFLIGYYACYGIRIVGVIVKKYRAGERKAAVGIIKNAGIFAAISALIIGVVYAKTIVHILMYDYGDRYASFMNGGFSAEILNQAKLIALFYGIIMIVGIVYTLAAKKNYMLSISAIAGIFIGIGLFTRIQNMWYHQNLLLLPYYQLLIIIGVTAVVALGKSKVICCITGGLILLGGGYSAEKNCISNRTDGIVIPNCSLVVEERSDMVQIKEAAQYLYENVGDNRIYIIPHDERYNPQIFANVIYPDVYLAKKVYYGSAVLGTHEFPTGLLNAKYVCTYSPYYAKSKITALAKKYDEVFNSIKDRKFKLAKEFDMGDGYTFYIYERIEKTDMEEINTYMKAFKEENEKFPDLYEDVVEKFIAENGIE